MKVPRCKGMRDILPDDMAKFRYIEDVFRRCSSQWGYDEVRTPTLEYMHLFTATGTLTLGMLGRVYSFLDWDGWSGERVVLRPEGTIPVARMCAENALKIDKGDVARYAYVANVFTFEETGKEHREQWQCGVELIGASNPIADVELVLLAVEVLESLGLGPVEIGLSHAGLIKALIAALGLNADEQTEIFDQVLEGNIAALGDVKTKDKELKKALKILLDVKGSSAGYLENISAIAGKSLAGLEPSLSNFIAVARLLSAAGCSYHIDIASGRGFEYYTGAMFQFYAGKQRVGGGGRYDDLISLVGGPHIPASGFGLYVDRLMDIVKLKDKPRQRVLVMSSDKALDACIELARSLRQSGYTVAFELSGESSAHYRWVVTPAGSGKFKLIDREKVKKIDVASAADIKKAVEGAR